MWNFLLQGLGLGITIIIGLRLCRSKGGGEGGKTEVLLGRRMFPEWAYLDVVLLKKLLIEHDWSGYYLLLSLVVKFEVLLNIKLHECHSQEF